MRALLTAGLMLCGWAATQTQAVPGLPPLGTPTTTAPATPAPAPPLVIILLDGQQATLDVAFDPATLLGPAGQPYPPLGLSRANPAYYALQGEGGHVSLTVHTAQPRAALMLRAQSVPQPGQTSLHSLPLSRIEYSVNGAPWQPASSYQVIALLGSDGAGGSAGTFDIRLRLRLEGDEVAGTSQVLLTWSVEGQ